MTKERRLAIQMWEHVKAEIASNSFVNIVSIKDKFHREHELDWCNECWFCNYIQCCDKCPLQGCSVYGTVLDCRQPLEVRLNACDAIINALKGKK